MAQRKFRDYEVSLWSLQDSFIAILKQYGLEYKGQIQKGKLQDRDDGTQIFSFTIPMYYRKNGELIENPSWYNVKSGALLVNMRKIKVIFNKEDTDIAKRKVYEFLIVKVKERHETGQLFCDVECEGLAFHELGKIGYKISLSADDFYNDDYKWSTDGKWYDSLGNEHTLQPLATLNYWNEKVFSTVNNWTYDIQMNWKGYSLYLQDLPGIIDDSIDTNDTIHMLKLRKSNHVYEDDFVDSWETDENNNLIPAHITRAKEKTRINVDINESNIYNITQTLAEIFNVYCKYVYEYDNNFHIIARTVVYYNNFINEENGIININYKHQTSTVTREVDSTDLVTKLFVKGIEDNSSPTGSINILDVEANKTQEDYILNFDYLYLTGGITLEQYKSVELYEKKIRELNSLINILSDKVIALLSKHTELLAEFTTINNAIIKDTELLFSNKELLNTLTNNSEVLRVTENNPQLAVLLKDTSTEYDSYFIKITQKGVYPLSIKLYKTYNYANACLSDEITIGKVLFDEFGNVIKVSNLFIDENYLSKTVYLIYDYRPILYYERIQNMWLSRLASDNARKVELEAEIAKINYVLYGKLPEQKINNIKVNDVYDFNILLRYLNLIKEKNLLIKDFNLIMGPAIRLGYWQPDDYTDYGIKCNEKINIGNLSINNNTINDGKVSFVWDKELFDNEQKLYYEYSAEQKKIAYPCIDLSKHPEILRLIQNNLNDNICFYYNPISSLLDTRYSRIPPIVNKAPEIIYVITGLDGNIWSINAINYIIEPVRQEYPDLFTNEKYKPYLGYLCQEWNEDSYKIGYSAFKWQGLPPNSKNNTWEDITYFTLNVGVDYGTPLKYSMGISSKYSSAARFTDNEDFIQEIQLRSNDRINWDGWQFRLIVKNNMGSNLSINGEWDNGEFQVQPTLIKELINNAEFIPVEAYKNQVITPPDAATSSPIVIGFNLTENHTKDATMKYLLQYLRVKNNENINLTTWTNHSDEINEDLWKNVKDADSIFKNENIVFELNDLGVQFTLPLKNYYDLNIEAEELWRFRLVFWNIVDCRDNVPHHHSLENSRIYVGTTSPVFSHVVDNTAHINLNNTYSYEASVYIDLPVADFLHNNGEPRNSNYQIINDGTCILWKKINPKTQEISNISEGISSEKIRTVCYLYKNTVLRKYYTTFTITANQADKDLLIKLDGYYIYPLVKNKNNEIMIVPENYHLLIKLDCYKPIEIINNLIDTYTYPLYWKEDNNAGNENNENSSSNNYDSYEFSITGKNISNFKWRILFDNQINLNEGEQQEGLENSQYIEISDEVLEPQQIYSSNNKYTVQKSIVNNKDVLTLTLFIPRIDLLNSNSFYNTAYLNNSRITCEMWNETDAYYIQPDRLSNRISNTCILKMNSVLKVNELPTLLNMFYELYPKRNIYTDLGDSYLLPYKIPLTFKFLKVVGLPQPLLDGAITMSIKGTNEIDAFSRILETAPPGKYSRTLYVNYSMHNPLDLQLMMLVQELSKNYLEILQDDEENNYYNNINITIINNSLPNNEENTTINDILLNDENNNDNEELRQQAVSEFIVINSPYIVKDDNNIEYYAYDSVLKIVPPRILDKWYDLDNGWAPQRIIYSDTSVREDQRFIYCYKITINFIIGSGLKKFVLKKSFYIRVTIRQRAPQFIEGSKWQPQTMNPLSESAIGLTIQVVKNTELPPSDDQLINILRRKLQRPGLAPIVTLDTCIQAKDLGFDDNTVEKYEWQLGKWYATRILNITNSKVVYNKESQVREVLNAVAQGNSSSINLLPQTVFTLKDTLVAKLHIQPYGTILTESSASSYSAQYQYYTPTGLVDYYDTLLGLNLAIGYARNLYLRAYNMWGYTQTKLIDVQYVCSNSIPSSESLGGTFLVYDPKQNKFKFLSERYGLNYRPTSGGN